MPTMVIPTRTCPSDTSVSSEIDELSFDEKRIKIFTRQMLKGRRFKGTFQEKRYVDNLNSYRDVVSLAKVEEDLMEDILEVKRRVEDVYPMNHWLGITTPDMIGAPASYSLWVELPENTPFGAYCFKIKRVKFTEKETCLRVQIIYPLDQDMHKTGEHKEQTHENNILPSDTFADIKEDINRKLLYLLQNITFSNLKGTVKFLFMLLATLTVLLFEILKHLSEFSLKFMNEFSNFMRSSAPVFQILANLVERMFRTVCMLIAFLIKGRGPLAPPRPPYGYPRAQYAYSNLRALPPAGRRHGVIIEEIQ